MATALRPMALRRARSRMDADSGSQRARTRLAPASAQAATVLAFGSFRLDGRRRTLTSNGREVVLQPRAFDLLELFASCSGQVLSNDEIVGHVWRGIAVGDNNLSVQLSGLRRVLAEHGGQGLIVTVPGRGYRFTGDVVAETPPPASLRGVPLAPSCEQRHLPRRGHMRIGIAVAGVLVVAVGLAVLLWRRPAPAARPPATALAEPFNPPPHSVAVLAFTNLSGDPEQEYLSDGLSDELIDSLSRIPELRVVARTSSFYFKGKASTIDEIARRLNVAAVLEGSVRRVGSKLRITAHLSSAATGYELWSESVDRDQNDLLDVQHEIAAAVAGALQTKLIPDAPASAAIGATTNPQAFDAYLQGIRAWAANPGYRGDRAAIAAFDKALALDANFASAYVQRALTIQDLVDFGGEPDVVTSRRMLDDAFADVNRAISIAPGLAFAYGARAMLELDRSFDFPGAAADYAHGLALSPYNVLINTEYGAFQTNLGHFAAGIAAEERAILYDPLGANTFLRAAVINYLARRFDDALAALRHAEALGEPGPTRGRGLRGLIQVAMGNAEEASRTCAPEGDLAVAECTVIALHKLGKVTESALAKLQAFAGDSGAYNYAEIYAQWGQPDEALHWLSRAFDLRDNGLLFLKVDPMLDPIRSTPAFADIEQHMHFPP